MRASVLARLAIAGTKTDRVRVAVTAFGSAAAVLSWLCAATVATLGISGSDHGSAGDNQEYTTTLIREPGLRPGVIATFILLTIPVLALVAQSARLGAPARDRRIAAMRLAGATPGQAVAIGAGESGVAAALGSVLGLVAFLVLRAVLDNPDAHGQRALPTDVLPAAWAIVVICVSLPVVVGLISARLLRRATTSPLGVAGRTRRSHGPRPWPGLLIIGGVALFAVFGPLTKLLSRHGVEVSGTVAITMFYLGIMSTSVGIALGAGWIAHIAGRILGRHGRSAASQLAAARLVADPWQGSRAFGVLMIAALFGGGTAAVYVNFATMQSVQAAAGLAEDVALHQDASGPVDTFYTNATLLVAIAVLIAGVLGALGLLVSLSEAIVSRRRTYASLVASGVPRSVLVRTQLWQTFSVAVPALAVATVVGMLIPRYLLGTSISGGGDQYSLDDGTTVMTLPTIHRTVPIPWEQIGFVAGIALASIAVTVGIGLLFLKASTSVEELRTA